MNSLTSVSEQPGSSNHDHDYAAPTVPEQPRPSNHDHDYATTTVPEQPGPNNQSNHGYAAYPTTAVTEQSGHSNHDNQDHDYAATPETEQHGPRNLQTSATTVTEQTGQSNNFNLDHDYVCMKIVRTYVSMKSDQLNCHENAFELVKKIISTYVVLRLKHHMKEENERIKKKRIRSRLSKLIIFKGQ